MGLENFKVTDSVDSVNNLQNPQDFLEKVRDIFLQEIEKLNQTENSQKVFIKIQDKGKLKFLIGIEKEIEKEDLIIIVIKYKDGQYLKDYFEIFIFKKDEQIILKNVIENIIKQEEIFFKAKKIINLKNITAYLKNLDNLSLNEQKKLIREKPLYLDLQGILFFLRILRY